MIKIKKKFDSRSLKWDKDSMFNEIFLRYQLNYFNDVLQSCGFVFLRDVYMALGLDITSASCILGWKKDDKNSKNFIGFRYYQLKDSYEPEYELIFECYPIIDYLEEENGVV